MKWGYNVGRTARAAKMPTGLGAGGQPLSEP